MMAALKSYLELRLAEKWDSVSWERGAWYILGPFLAAA